MRIPEQFCLDADIGDNHVAMPTAPVQACQDNGNNKTTDITGATSVKNM